MSKDLVAGGGTAIEVISLHPHREGTGDVGNVPAMDGGWGHGQLRQRRRSHVITVFVVIALIPVYIILMTNEVS